MIALLRLSEGTPAIQCAHTLCRAKASQQHYFWCCEKCCEHLFWWYAEVLQPGPRTEWIVPSMLHGCLTYVQNSYVLVCVCVCECAPATYSCAAHMWAHTCKDTALPRRLFSRWLSACVHQFRRWKWREAFKSKESAARKETVGAWWPSAANKLCTSVRVCVQ